MLKSKILAGLTILSAMAFFISRGCAPEQLSDEKNQDLLRDSIMVIHDEVMPRMSEVNRIQREMKEIIQDTTVIASELLLEAGAIIAALEAADEGMMSWMNQFTQPQRLRDSKTHFEIMAYLDAEKQKVIQVKSNILTSIEKGTKFLESNSKKDSTN